MIVTQPLVEQALQRTLELAEYESLEFLSQEAEALISGYVGIDYADPEVVTPSVVQTVAARMLARALSTDTSKADIASEQQTTGPYSQNVVYVAASRTGNAVYLSSTDKVMLKKVKPSVVSIGLKTVRSA